MDGQDAALSKDRKRENDSEIAMQKGCSLQGRNIQAVDH